MRRLSGGVLLIVAALAAVPVAPATATVRGTRLTSTSASASQRVRGVDRGQPDEPQEHRRRDQCWA